jgi:beta-lactam-binding protein with PASTA domain
MQGPPQRQWQPQATTLQRSIPPGGLPPGPPERRSSPWVMAVLAGLGVLVVVVLGVALAMSRNNDNKPTNTSSTAAQVQMPNLSGKTDQQAQNALQQLGLTKIVPLSPSTGSNCDGKVFNQTPQAGQSITVDTQGSYQLCQPPNQVTVPSDLVGSTQQNAEDTLTGLGLNPEIKQVDDTHQAGTVLSVESQGKKVDPGTKITVKVSKGNQFAMPYVIGKTQDVAQGILDSNGLNVNVKTVVGDGTQPAGTVVAQDPSKGTSVTKTQTVTITVVGDNPDPSESASAPTDGGGGGNGGVGLFN